MYNEYLTIDKEGVTERVGVTNQIYTSGLIRAFSSNIQILPIFILSSFSPICQNFQSSDLLLADQFIPHSLKPNLLRFENPPSYIMLTQKWGLNHSYSNEYECNIWQD